MNTLDDIINNFSFNIEFNEPNMNRFNVSKKLKPISDHFDKISKLFPDKVCVELQNSIIEQIKNKIKTELDDEKDLVKIYQNKLRKFIEREKESNIPKKEFIKKITNIIETPLEGEIAKHNKVKILTVKINNCCVKSNISNVLFYVKYREISKGYNKQFRKILDTLDKLNTSDTLNTSDKLDTLDTLETLDTSKTSKTSNTL